MYRLSEEGYLAFRLVKKGVSELELLQLEPVLCEGFYLRNE